MAGNRPHGGDVGVNMRTLLILVSLVLLASPVLAQAPSCEDTRAIVAKFADVVSKERTDAQVALAQALAENEKLKAQIDTLKKPKEEPKK